MNAIDWSIIFLYMFGMIGLSVYLGRKQSTQDDYYVGGRKISWWAVGISTMATQTSAISFISIPAFVALKPNGGFSWLQYELAVPLAMILVITCLIPFFRKLKLISVYEYLELRFSPEVRYLVSAVFLISRGLATGVGVYATGIVLSVCLEIPLWGTILIIGVVTVIYDTIGGIIAVIYSDVIQMAILMFGILACIVYAANIVGGVEDILTAFPAERLNTIDSATGLGDGGTAPFWAFLIGGFFLYSSYYGTDQSQVQRGLSAKTVEESVRALMFNGIARFPLTLLYIILGVAAFAVYQHSPELAASVPADRPDYLIPQFILLKLPTGLRALMFAALLAAAMSSLDSALNSLSAATMRDFIEKRLGNTAHYLKWSKITTVCWGAFITAFAFFVGNISDTVIEGINKIGSAFYGPILAAFLTGILLRRTTSTGIFIGIFCGVAFNLILWFGYPGIHWMWWNVFGCAVAGITAIVISRIGKTETSLAKQKYLLRGDELKRKMRAWSPYYKVLMLYFITMLIIMFWIQH